MLLLQVGDGGRVLRCQVGDDGGCDGGCDGGGRSRCSIVVVVVDEGSILGRS
jgi:hypothetical protein